LGIAVFISQFIFTLSHIPQWIEYGIDTPLLPAIVLLLGLVFTTIYLLTGNLFIVMAFHALHDAPTALLASPVDPHLLMLLIELTCIVWIWQRHVSKRSVNETAVPPSHSPHFPL
jgi:membrane protease YdiL (CAAX protease family)